MTLRDKFEAWAITQHFAIHRNGGEQYVNTATHHAWTGWQACDQCGHAWRDVVTDALVVAGIYTAQHDTDPRKALADLIAWEVQVALDPAVSKDAAALVARGRAQGLEEAAAAVEHLRDDHCAGTKQSPNKHDWCEHDDVACEFVVGWNDAIAAIRQIANPEGEPS